MRLALRERRRSWLLQGEVGGGGASKQNSRGSVIQENEFDRLAYGVLYHTMER